MNTRNKVLVGIAGALAAGAVIGLLMAPEKGKEMRKKISKTAGGWADGLSHLWSRAKHAAGNGQRMVKEKTSAVRDTGFQTAGSSVL